MIAVLSAVFVVCAAVWLVFVFRAPAHLKNALAVAKAAAAALRDPAATDDDKEKAAQRCSTQLFGLFLLILFSFVGALLAPVGVLWGLDRLGLISLHAALGMLMSVRFLIVTTVIGTAVGALWPRLRALGASSRT